MGGTPKPPEIRMPVLTPPPKPDPLPPPVPTEIAPLITAQARRKRIAMARQGILSTIRTSPMGIVGAGAELGPGRGKKKMGE